MTLALANVLTLFAPGTAVDAYLDAIEDSGTPRPLGPVIDSAVVGADGSLAFNDLEADGTLYVLAAEVGGHWRLLRAATPAPEPEGSSALLERIEALEVLVAQQAQVVFFGEDVETPRPVGAGSVIWVGIGLPDNFAGGQDLLLNASPD